MTDNGSRQPTRKTFVNLPVRDLAKTVEFFSRLGFSFDPQITDENTACMIISDDAYAMLHVADAFAEFTGTPVADTATGREVIVGLTAASREQVDELVERVADSGGQAFREPQDQGFMYMRAFRDLDGHQWSLLYLDPSASPAP